MATDIPIMSNSPHPTDNSNPPEREGYVLPRKDYTIMPAARGDNPAADVIRDKLAKIYASEPSAEAEEKQAEAAHPRSAHQQFMFDLNNSGKDLAQIQTEWHNYYVALNDEEKHSVWQEFYASNETAHHPTIQLPADTPTPAEKMATVRTQIGSHSTTHKKAREDRRDAAEIQQEIRGQVRKRPPKLAAKQHAQSLLFGLGVGLVTVMIFLFGFFNELIIAPFIQPARTSAATPLIVSTDTVAPSNESQVIIPKINVQIPIQFNATSTNEETMQKELESGVAHYPTTSDPGQDGNAAYFGHSSNNIFNKGKYKFAFVLLHELVPGDTFYITKDGKLYAYKVFSKTVVEPNQIEVLNPVEGHKAVATLITCDPPGTSLRRLVIVGDQISPDPNANAIASTADASLTSDTTQLAGNGQTLWGRFISEGIGKATIGLLVVGAVIVLFRRSSRQRY
ncbi:hypothetical protein BH09PAT3_BH09PAT3_6210 [soil metagenome]